MTTRLILGYLGACVYLYLEQVLPLYGKNGKQKVLESLQKNKQTDFLAVYDWKTIRAIISCMGILALAILPIKRTITILKKEK